MFVCVSLWLKLAELNGLEPSSAWLTTKCLTSRPQFLARLAARVGFEPDVRLIEAGALILLAIF